MFTKKRGRPSNRSEFFADATSDYVDSAFDSSTEGRIIKKIIHSYTGESLRAKVRKGAINLTRIEFRSKSKTSRRF